jgi:hypothetical protein
MDACKRALSLCAKLPKEDRKKWLSQTFKNMNIVRAALRRVQKTTTPSSSGTGGLSAATVQRTNDLYIRLQNLERQMRSMARESGVSLREDTAVKHEISTRIRRFMHENDIHYPGVDSLEDLQKAHAQQILDKGGWKGADSEERGLAHAIGIANLSNDELEDIIRRPHTENGQSVWEFQENDMAFSGGDTLHGPTVGNRAYVIARETDEHGKPADAYQGLVMDVDDGHQPNDDDVIWTNGPDSRNDLEDWCDVHGLPHPSEEDWANLGL